MCQVDRRRRAAADRVRRAQCARRAQGAAGDRRREAAGRHRRSGAPSCAASSRTACCARAKELGARRRCRRACWNCRPTRRWASRWPSYLGLPDASIELKLTPNRADCLGLRGAGLRSGGRCSRCRRSRSTCARCRRATTRRCAVRPAMPAPIARAICGRVDRRRRRRAPPRRCGWPNACAAPACARSARWWTVTNYVMLELGQPMHAFDARPAARARSWCAAARDGEDLKLLDGREVALDDGFLMITDADASARRDRRRDGRLGHARHRRDAATCSSRAAHFAPDRRSSAARASWACTPMPRTASSAASIRSCRARRSSAPPRWCSQIAGGAPGPVIEAVLPRAPAAAPRRCACAARAWRACSASRCRTREVERILRGARLGGRRRPPRAGPWRRPTRRFDIAIEEDLIEEIARIHGYDADAGARARRRDCVVAPEPEGRVRGLGAARAAGARATTRKRLTSPSSMPTLLAHVAARRGRGRAGQSALRTNWRVMRTSLLPGLVDALRRNLARQAARVRLFEIGQRLRGGQRRRAASRRSASPRSPIGSAARRAVGRGRRRALDFHDLKGDVEQLAGHDRRRGVLRVPAGRAPVRLHPGRSAEIVRRDGRRSGWIGQLHPRLAQGAGPAARSPGSSNWSSSPWRPAPCRVAAELSRLPSVRRDLAIVVAGTVPWAALESGHPRPLPGPFCATWCCSTSTAARV